MQPISKKHDLIDRENQRPPIQIKEWGKAAIRIALKAIIILGIGTSAAIVAAGALGSAGIAIPILSIASIAIGVSVAAISFLCVNKLLANNYLNVRKNHMKNSQVP
jgi:hypothetical protein